MNNQMTDPKIENPAAFPQTHVRVDQKDGNIEFTGFQDGMTLRDYFAAKASEEDIAEYRLHAEPDEHGHLRPKMSREQAKFAYADAMLKARLS